MATTIAALSTAPQTAGIHVIRISGDDSVKILKKVFRPASNIEYFEHARMYYGHVMDNGVALDEGYAVSFYNPKSYTGEDVIEISCHGGILITRKVLSAVLLAGARAAEAGEFTRRAYVSGKMKLTEAEALGDLLEARSESQLVLARGGMQGRLSSKMGELYDSLRRVLSGIYAVIDFPDEDLSDMSREEIEDELSRVVVAIRALSATYGTGRAVNEGIPTVICGRTNAGKSSVYNRILGYDAAIVTDIEGTTRDVLRETAIFGKVTLLLCDTAGLRTTDDKVENIGIERTVDAIGSAGLILAVFDASRLPDDDDVRLAELAKGSGASSIALINKSDISSGEAWNALCSAFDRTVRISASTGEGFEELRNTVEQMFMDGDIDIENDAVVTGARQYAALTSSADLLERALNDIRAGMSLDACCVGVECAMSALGEADGREIGEEIVSEIFSRFCVGK